MDQSIKFNQDMRMRGAERGEQRHKSATQMNLKKGDISVQFGKLLWNFPIKEHILICS